MQTDGSLYCGFERQTDKGLSLYVTLKGKQTGALVYTSK